ERAAAYGNGQIEAEEIGDVSNRCAGITTSSTEIPAPHRPAPTRKRAAPLNIVIIVEASLGAQYVSSIGGADLAPNIDRLSGQGWNFTRTYATGTRSVRGLEAIVAGFPPTISDAVLRLSGAQRNFFTLAQLLKQHGYRSRFIYGGEAHFDNMKGFFL